MSDQKNLAYRPLKVPKRHVESRLASAVASGRSAELTHEIFYDRFADFIFCTDEFAVKILQSVCSGMIFFDPFDFFQTIAYISVPFAASKRKLIGIQFGRLCTPN